MGGGGGASGGVGAPTRGIQVRAGVPVSYWVPRALRPRALQWLHFSLASHQCTWMGSPEVCHPPPAFIWEAIRAASPANSMFLTSPAGRRSDTSDPFAASGRGTRRLHQWQLHQGQAESQERGRGGGGDSRASIVNLAFPRAQTEARPTSPRKDPCLTPCWTSGASSGNLGSRSVLGEGEVWPVFRVLPWPW